RAGATFAADMRINAMTARTRKRSNKSILSASDIASQWKRVCECSNGSRKSEYAQLKQLWSTDREPWRDLTYRGEDIQEAAQKLKEAGFGYLACVLFEAAKTELSYVNPDIFSLINMEVWIRPGQKWGEKGPRPLDLLRVLLAQVEIEGGASERQAA